MTSTCQPRKGQLILECPFGVFKSPKNPTIFFSKISVLASKKRLKSRTYELFVLLFGGFYIDSLIPLFLFDLSFEARAEILEKILLVFWSKWWHQKDILKLSDL